MKLATLLGASLLLSLLVANANAATLTQTRALDSESIIIDVDDSDTSESIYWLQDRNIVPLSKFDPSLGTLSGVQVTFTGTGRNSAIEENPTDVLTATGTNSFNTSVSTKAGTTSNSYVLDIPGTSLLNEFNIIQSNDFTASETSGFIGTDSIDYDIMLKSFMTLALDACTASPITICEPNVMAGYSGDLEIAYEYTPDTQPQNTWTQTRSIDSELILIDFEEPSGSEARYLLGGSEIVPISQFDPSLGTLTGIEISFNGIGQNTVAEESPTDLLTATGMNTITANASTGGFTVVDNFNLNTPGTNLLNEFLIDQSFGFITPETNDFLGTGSINVNLVMDTLMTLALDSCTAPPFTVCEPIVQAGFRGDLVVEYHFDRLVSPIPVPAAVWLFGTALIGLIGFGKRRTVVQI